MVFNHVAPVKMVTMALVVTKAANQKTDRVNKPVLSWLLIYIAIDCSFHCKMDIHCVCHTCHFSTLSTDVNNSTPMQPLPHFCHDIHLILCRLSSISIALRISLHLSEFRLKLCCMTESVCHVFVCGTVCGWWPTCTI